MSPNSEAAPKQPFVVKKTTGRDVTIAVLAGALVLAFVLWGILHMSQGVSGRDAHRADRWQTL